MTHTRWLAAESFEVACRSAIALLTAADEKLDEPGALDAEERDHAHARMRAARVEICKCLAVLGPTIADSKVQHVPVAPLVVPDPNRQPVMAGDDDSIPF